MKESTIATIARASSTGWMIAPPAMSGSDREAGLGAEDLERLATSAYMLGGDDDYLNALGRAHHACLDAGDAGAASRSRYRVRAQ